jgi:hypothetical protein
MASLMKGNAPLTDLLTEINATVTKAPLLAVAMTVALPDICVSLVSEDGRSSGPRYRRWCAANLQPDYFGSVTPRDLYSMRCGVLHNGRFGDMQHDVARVIFRLPGSGSITNHKIDDAWHYGVVEFCKNFTESVTKWLEENSDDPTLVANLPRMMQYRQGGLPPYVVGPTVLA